MFSSTLLWIGLGLLLLVVVILYNTPRAKAARVRKAEEYRRQEEERKRKKKAEAARKAQQMENFRKQCLVVYIREKDGRKSSFEAVMIRALLEKGLTIGPLPENNGRAIAGGDTSSLKNGLLALVGTSWHKNGTDRAYDYGGASLGTYKWEATYCDYRLLVATEDGAGKILGVGCAHRSDTYDSSHENNLANSIIEDLASTFPATSGAS